MMSRRFLKVTAALLALLLAVAVAFGYDFHLESNITETFVERSVD